MKKLLAVSLLVTVGIGVGAVNASAETTELTAEFTSDYTLTIPKNQTIKTDSTEIGDMFISGTITPTQTITVGMAHDEFARVGGSETLAYTLETADAEVSSVDFNEIDIIPDAEKKVPLSVVIPTDKFEAAKAGEYKSSVIFTVKLNDTKK